MFDFEKTKKREAIKILWIFLCPPQCWCACSRFDLHIEFSKDEVEHYLLPQERVVDSFVICDDSGNVTDLCSFYHLPSSIIKHEKYKTLNAAYSFYNIAKTVPLKELMNDCLTLAKLVSSVGWLY